MKRIFCVVVMTLMLPAISFAYTLVGYPRFQAFDGNGDPLSGGKLYTYEAGSGTSKSVYQYSTGTAHTNPVILDSRGEATIYFNGSYKLILKDSYDALIWSLDNFQGTGVEYDTTSSVSGFIAISAESGTSQVRFVQYISGASIEPGSITSAMLPDPITSGVSTSQTVTGKSFFIDLTSSETLSGQSVFGSAIGNYGSTTGVTATLPSALKGMSMLFMLTQGQAGASSIYVKFNSADNVTGVSGNFSTGNSVIVLSGTTLNHYLQLDAWQDNKWYATGSSGITYRNQ